MRSTLNGSTSSNAPAPKLSKLRAAALLAAATVLATVSTAAFAQPMPQLEAAPTAHDLGPDPSETVIELNGAPFALARRTDATPFSTLVDNAEAACDGGGQWEFLKSPVVKVASPTQAVIGCWVKNAGTPREPLAWLLRGEPSLAAVGEFRVLFATRTTEGSSAVLFRTLSDVSFASLFPAQGDAPGSDFSELPRPDGRRVVSASHRSATLLNVYQNSAPGLARFEARARRSGLSVSSPPTGTGDRTGTLVVRSGDSIWLVTELSVKNTFLLTLMAVTAEP